MRSDSRNTLTILVAFDPGGGPIDPGRWAKCKFAWMSLGALLRMKQCYFALLWPSARSRIASDRTASDRIGKHTSCFREVSHQYAIIMILSRRVVQINNDNQRHVTSVCPNQAKLHVFAVSAELEGEILLLVAQ